MKGSSDGGATFWAEPIAPVTANIPARSKARAPMFPSIVAPKLEGIDAAWIVPIEPCSRGRGCLAPHLGQAAFGGAIGKAGEAGLEMEVQRTGRAVALLGDDQF